VWVAVDLVGQVTEVAAVVADPFTVAWVVVDKIFEGGNLIWHDKENSSTKVFVEARAIRALECSTFDSEHKEIENVVVTYL